MNKELESLSRISKVIETLKSLHGKVLYIEKLDKEIEMRQIYKSYLSNETFESFQSITYEDMQETIESLKNYFPVQHEEFLNQKAHVTLFCLKYRDSFLKNS